LLKNSTLILCKRGSRTKEKINGKKHHLYRLFKFFIEIIQKGSRKNMKALISYWAFKNLGIEIMPRRDVEIEKEKKERERKTIL
jgi:hypothetical protein